MKLLAVFATLGVVACLVPAPAVSADGSDIDKIKTEYRRPSQIEFPDNAPYSLQRATLGKMLFFDPRLSGAQNMNCASCHNPSFGYEMPLATVIGAANTPLERHSPTVLNLAWTPQLFWDGRVSSLEEQAIQPITKHDEMNGSMAEIVERLKAIDQYLSWFDRLFPGQGITQDTVMTAIATYERTIISGMAPFDRWVEGDQAAISHSAKQGFALFVGKAGCSACHSGWNFTDNQFHDIGLAGDDIGRGALEPANVLAQHAFKTPGLRNLTYRAPFMHDGSLPDIESVITHYTSGGMQRPSLSPMMHAVELSDQERNDLVAFLMSLTADSTETPIPVLPN